MGQKESIKSLLLRIAQGDESALGDLIDVYGPKLLAFCLKFIPEQALAEELVQDTFLKIWNNRQKLTKILSPEAYLFTMAKHLCLDYLRKIKKENELKTELLQKKEVSHNLVDDFIISKQYEELLSTVIKNLPQRQREIFEMSRHQGKSHKEIAQILGISPKTVDEHMSRALKAIRKQIFAYSSFILVIFTLLLLV